MDHNFFTYLIYVNSVFGITLYNFKSTCWYEYAGITRIVYYICARWSLLIARLQLIVETHC